MRTVIDTYGEQVQPLAEPCRRKELSRAEAIRRVIDLLLSTEARLSDQALGLWKDRGIDAVHYQPAMREGRDG